MGCVEATREAAIASHGGHEEACDPVPCGEPAGDPACCVARPEAVLVADQLAVERLGRGSLVADRLAVNRSAAVGSLQARWQ